MNYHTCCTFIHLNIKYVPIKRTFFYDYYLALSFKKIIIHRGFDDYLLFVGTTSCFQNHETVKFSVEKGDFGYVTSYDYPDNYTSDFYLGHSCNVEIRGCSTCKVKITLMDVSFPNCPAVQKIKHRNLCIPG